MKLASTCQEIAERLAQFLEGTIPPEDAGTVRAHLENCPACRAEVQRSERVRAVLKNTFGAGLASELNREETGRRLREISSGPLHAIPQDEDGELQAAPAGLLDSLAARFGAAPWWIVSGAFHALLLMLLFLIGMVMLQAPTKDTVILTSLEKKIEPPEEEKPKEREIFNNPVPVEMPITETVQSPVVIHEEAEIAEHQETDERMDSHDAFGDEGISDIPLGGSGISGAIGVGGGGAGAFGRPTGGGSRLRRALAGGGGKATESAVDKALDWLARHQEPDGHWDPRKYEGGQHNGTSEIGATGLALLAFLGAGHTEKVGKYKDHVRRAVEWFIQNQDAKSGQYKCASDPGSSRMYGHGIAAMAMSEAAAMGRVAETRQSAQKGVDFIAEAQNRPGGDESEGEGWDYKPRGGTNDTSVTSWMVLALKSAKVAGLAVEPRCFEGGMRWLDAAQGNDEYGLGIWYRGTVAEVAPQQSAKPRFNYNNSAAREHALLAAAGVMRLFLGGADKGDPRVAATADHMQKYLPAWKKGAQGGEKMCFYHLYYGTLFMFQAGGNHWKDWNEALKTTLLPNQVVGGDDDGSWDPGADWLKEWGGRVYTTAMGALCLEVYYRYLPIYR